MHKLWRISEQARDRLGTGSFVIKASSELVSPYLERLKINPAYVSTIE